MRFGCLICLVGVAPLFAEAPKALDDRLTVELFVEHPQLVTPTGLAVDAKGRVFVAESHTHFRPEDYKGPKADRILIFEDTTGDGQADRRTIFHSGFTHLMDLAFHPDGSLYVATRMDIHRMRDTNGDGKADEITPIVRMKTTGTYPHNGLSGLAFEFDGSFHFGLGENLGHAYTLIGSDGTELSGGGEGGSTYHVNADGTGLRRVSTGWWNPFGMCVDASGRVFGTDNDPGASPPCRLIQVVEDGDYGYEYRYGRTGLHPLTTWTGDLPGTLPMIAGTGEAPCAVLAYESDALPDEYRGQLFVASWADHQIERYRLTQPADSGFVRAEREILIRGPNEFRPVDMAIAPDGTIYVTDWVSASYALHGQGRIWRIRPREFLVKDRPSDPLQAMTSQDRVTREAAARTLAKSRQGEKVLLEQLRSLDSRVRMTALQALTTSNRSDALLLANQARLDTDPGVRTLALRTLLRLVRSSMSWADRPNPHWLRTEALAKLDVSLNPEVVEVALRDPDPALFRAGVLALSRGIEHPSDAVKVLRQRSELGWLLAGKLNPITRKTWAPDGLRGFLASKNPKVRLTAVKWIADDTLIQYRADLEQLLRSNDLDLRLFLATSAALDRLDGKDPQDQPAVPRLLARIRDDEAPVPVRQYALRLIDPNAKQLQLDDLARLRSHPDEGLRRDAIRTLAATGRPEATKQLAAIADDERQSSTVRAEAIAGLDPTGAERRNLLIRLTGSQDRIVRDEALRSLVGAELGDTQRETIRMVAQKDPDANEAVERILSDSPADRPADEDLDAWMKHSSGQGDPVAGERIFFGNKIGTCAKCHRVEGRGNAVGPDLTSMRRRTAALPDGRRWLMETILQPSKDMAPQYTPWVITMTDGRVLTGLPRRKGGSAEAYLGSDGKEFTLKKDQIETHEESPTSIMPRGLLNALTRRELIDLLAFLEQGTP